MELPITELQARIEADGTRSDQLREFCKFLALLQIDTKHAMVAKILEKVKGHEEFLVAVGLAANSSSNTSIHAAAGGVDPLVTNDPWKGNTVADSPEGRDGRERPVRPGVAASQVRAAAKKEQKTMVGQTRELEDDSFADLPSVPVMQQFDVMHAFIGLPSRPSQTAASLSTPLAVIRQRAAVVRAALEASVPRAPVIPSGIDGRKQSLAEEVARDYEPSGRDIMNVLGQIAKNMVVKDDLRAEITEALVPVYAHLQAVDAKSEKALQQSMNLNERRVAIGSKSLADSDRVGRLEAVVGSGDGLRVSDEFRRLFKANEAMDPAHSRIEFKGFSEKDSAHDRVCKIETAVIKILNGITYHVSHIPTGPRGKRTLGNSYLQFVSEFDREAAFAKLTGKVSFKNSKGEIVKFERARTKTQKTRNYYLFSAFDKAKEAFGETDVVINTKLPIR